MIGIFSVYPPKQLPGMLITEELSRAVEFNRNNTQLISYLQTELAISSSTIAMALRQSEQDHGPLHMVLWRYGLVSLEQLEQIFDWLER
jgi:hypothetical protein